jgi:hypothetical protein
MARTSSELDSNEVICILKDHYGAFIYTNRQMGNLFASPTGGFAGKTDYHLMPDYDAAAIRANDKHVLLTGNELRTIEWVHQEKRANAYLVHKFRIEVNGKMFLGCLGQNLGEGKENLELRAKAADEFLKPIKEKLQERLRMIATKLCNKKSRSSSSRREAAGSSK